MKQATVQFVATRLGDDIDDAASRASELRRSARGDDLEFLDGFERDVDRSALAADLFAEEAVVVVPSVEAQVVEDATLPGEVNDVAVRPLRDADARCEREQVFKLAPQHGRVGDGNLVECAAGLDLRRINRWRSCDRDRLVYR